VNKNIKTAALAFIIAGSVAMTGCAPEGTDAPAPAPVETTTAPEPVEVTVEDVQALPAGTVLTDEHVDALRGTTGTGVRAYTLPDGQKVLVQADQPLPDAVMADASQRLAAQERTAGDSWNELQATAKLMRDMEAALRFETGKSICPVMYLYSSNLNGPGASWQWITGCADPGGINPASYSKEAAIAAAEAHVAKQPHPEKWAIVVE